MHPNLEPVAGILIQEGPARTEQAKYRIDG